MDSHNSALEMNNSSGFQLGDIVWAAADGYRLWPALIYESKDGTFIKDKKIHVRFLCEVTTSWVNFRTSIVLFDGFNDFVTKSELEKRNAKKSESQRIKRKWKTTASKQWNLAICEAEILKLIHPSDRILAYDKILLDAIVMAKKKAKIEHSQMKKRCNTPQSIDTGYFSSNQPEAIADKMPLIPELGHQLDAHTKCENYLNSMATNSFVPIAMDVEVTSNPIVDSVYNCLLKNRILDKDKLYNAIEMLWQKIHSIEYITPKPKRIESKISSEPKLVKIEKKMNPPIDHVKLEKEEKKLEKLEEFEAEVRHCALDLHPDDYIFQNLPAEPVCERCFQSNDIHKCECNHFYHLNCMSIDRNCLQCLNDVCFVCKKNNETCRKCSVKNCKNIYHNDCLKDWFGANSTSICAEHVCRTCNKRTTTENVLRCVQCPATYHHSSTCIPAGCQLISKNQLICVEHSSKTIIRSDRMPINGDIIWAKYRAYPWWPAVIVPSPRIPNNILKCQENSHQVCVLFFGEYTYGWVPPMNICLYQNRNVKRTTAKGMSLAIEQAEKALQIRIPSIKPKKQSNSEPKPYRSISMNKGFSKYQRNDSQNLSKIDTICSCTPSKPCSRENDCLNWHSMVECDPATCPAKENCQNQNFRLNLKVPTNIKTTKECGFGLFAANKIPKHKFIIEFVGEIIDTIEFERRFSVTTRRKRSNFYFFQLDHNLYIDAALHGNDARFINNSCEPNAITNKWIVNGHHRLGIFANRDIEAGEEITYQYNWNTNSTPVQAVCRCGTNTCRGYL